MLGAAPLACTPLANYDDLNARRGIAFAVAETEAVANIAVKRARTVVPSIAEVESVAAASKRARKVVPSIAEAEVVTSALARTIRVDFPVVEAETVTSAVARTKRIVTSITEAETVTAGLGRGRSTGLMITEAESVGFVNSRTRGFRPTITEAETSTAAIRLAMTVQPTITEAESAAVAIRLAKTIRPAITEAESVSGSIRRTRTVRPTIAEAETLTMPLGRKWTTGLAPITATESVSFDNSRTRSVSTFTRGSVATYFDSTSNTIKTVAADVLRIENGAPLVESQLTTLSWPSRPALQSTTYYSNSDANEFVEGQLGRRYTRVLAGTPPIGLQTYVAAGQTLTHWIIVEADSSDPTPANTSWSIRWYRTNGTPGNWAEARIRPSTGAIVGSTIDPAAVAGTTYGSKKLADTGPNGGQVWQFWVSTTLPTDGFNYIPYVYTYGDVGQVAIIHHRQTEPNRDVTSAVLATSAAVTRAADLSLRMSEVWNNIDPKRTRWVVPSVVEAETASASAIRTRKLQPSIVEAGAASAAVKRARTVRPTITESESVNIALARLKKAAFSIAEASGYSFANARTRWHTFAVNEAEALSFGSIRRTRNVLSAINEMLTATFQTPNRARTVRPVIAEAESLNVLLRRVLDLEASIVESEQFPNLKLSRARRVGVVLAEIEALTTKIARLRLESMLINESKAFSGVVLNRARRVVATVAELEAFTLRLARTKLFVASINETEGLTLRVDRLKRVLVTVTESHGLVAAVKRVRRILDHIEETTGFTVNTLHIKSIYPSIIGLELSWKEWVVKSTTTTATVIDLQTKTAAWEVTARSKSVADLAEELSSISNVSVDLSGLID